MVPAPAGLVIVATDDDLANLEIAVDVREIRRDLPIVMRLFDQRLAQKVKTSLGIDRRHPPRRRQGGGGVAARDRRGVHAAGPARPGVPGLGLTPVAIRTGEAAWELPPAPDRLCCAGAEIQVMVPISALDRAHTLARG